MSSCSVSSWNWTWGSRDVLSDWNWICYLIYLLLYVYKNVYSDGISGVFIQMCQVPETRYVIELQLDILLICLYMCIYRLCNLFGLNGNSGDKLLPLYWWIIK